VPSLIDRRAFFDLHGLTRLGQGEVPSANEARRYIFVIERQAETGRPDHFFKGYLNARLGAVRHIGEIAPLVLGRLADRYLERRDGRIAVRYDAFTDWHQLLPFISPLAVIVAFLVGEEEEPPRPGEDPRDRLEREIGESALIAPCDRGLDDMVERTGLCELHMHLNGSTELDVLWPDAAAAPDDFYRELRRQELEDGLDQVAELYAQLEPGLDARGVYLRLRAARRVRHQLAAELAACPPFGPSRGGSPAVGERAVLEAAALDLTDGEWSARVAARRSVRNVSDGDVAGDASAGVPLGEHPSRILFGGRRRAAIVEEAAFLHACLHALRHDPGHAAIGIGLYFNLLAMTLVARLSVQQVDLVGFDQFQKYTRVGVRERIERRYGDRFRQLNGRAPFRTLAHLEGRFAPKQTREGTADLLQRIVADYLHFRGCPHQTDRQILVGPPPPCLSGRQCPTAETVGGSADGRTAPGREGSHNRSAHGPNTSAGPPSDGEGCGVRGRPGAEFALVAHFIKTPRRPVEDAVARRRDCGLRSSLERQARALSGLLDASTVARGLVLGVDGAANELHAPPEPFAAAFRHARATGIRWATFHAGEDFPHLLSGIRAVFEAAVFLDLRAGDRIGHATALGIAPSLWRERSAPRVVLCALDALDDAVFAHRALARIGGFERDLARLEPVIAELSARIYGQAHSPLALQRAWELRTLDIGVVRGVEASLERAGREVTPQAVEAEARILAATVLDGWQRRELRLITERVGAAREAYGLFVQRHALSAEDSEARREVDAGVVSDDAFAALQDHVLAEVARRGIALETLPTSNLRISFYREMKEHHLFRWMGLAEPPLANRPAVVVGSDDPGIFATNLRNEYAAVGAVLREAFGLSAPEALGRLQKLAEDARIHRFR
jgi:adenosine deaminase